MQVCLSACKTMATVKRHPKYHAYLVSLMSFIDNTDYGKDQEVTPTELSVITATNVKNWLEMKAYGVANPGPNNQPTH